MIKSSLVHEFKDKSDFQFRNINFSPNSIYMFYFVQWMFSLKVI